MEVMLKVFLGNKELLASMLLRKIYACRNLRTKVKAILMIFEFFRAEKCDI